MKRSRKLKIKVIKKNHTKKRKRRKKKTKKVYDKDDFRSGDGMLTSVWGPSLWHYLHTMSFNYPVKPSKKDKINYKNFIYSLKTNLPCKYCRNNMKKNLRVVPLNNNALKNRENFSKWMFRLHEHINKMLGKKSGLTYCDVRERYEHFRARCLSSNSSKTFKKTRKKREKGCTEPLYGKKAKCVIHIVPQEFKSKTFNVHNKCIIKR